MMKMLFGQVFQLTLVAGVVILVVLAVRALVGKRLPAVFSYTLWLLVLFRLLVPSALSSPVSALNVIPQETRRMAAELPQEFPAGQEAAQGAQAPPRQDGGGYAPSSQTPPASAAQGNASPPPATLAPQSAGAMDAGVFTYLGWVWFVGAVGLLAFFAALYRRTVSQFATAVLFDCGGVLADCQRQLGMNRRVRVFLSDRVDSPVVCGLLRPRIILPYDFREKKDSRRFQYILTHELVHIKRLDYILKPLYLVALSIHWFNPLVWLAAMLCDRDMELSCDQRVMSAWQGDIRAEYAGSLLTISSRQNGIHSLMDGGLLAFGESDIKTRIKRILGYHKPGFGAMAAGVALMLVLTACLATNPGGEQKAVAPDDLREAVGEEITDPAVIQDLWDDLMYYAIVGLQDDFSDPRELDTWTLISFATDRYLGSHDLHDLQMTMATVDENFGERSYYVLPFAQVSAQIKEIFGLEVSLEGVDFEALNGYGPYRDAAGAGGLLLEEGAEGRYEGVGPMAENPWGYYIERVLRLEGGSLVVSLCNNTYQTDLVNMRRFYLLQPHEEGEGYFIQRCQMTYVNNHLAGLTGTYQELAFAWDGYAPGGVSLIWEDGGSLYLFDGAMPGEEEGQRFVYLHRITKIDGTETAAARLPVTVDEQQNVNPSIRHISKGFLLKDAVNAYYLDENFQVTKTVPVPQALKEKMQYVYDPETNQVSAFFGGYEVTEDLSAWYYSCQDGLFRYDAATGIETLLVEPVYGEGRLMEGAIIVPRELRLVAGESKLIYITYGYEGIGQMMAMDLATGAAYQMPVAYYGGFGGTYYGAGHTTGNEAAGDREVSIDTFRFAGNATVRCAIPLPEWMDRSRDYAGFEMVCPTGRSYAAASLSIVNRQGEEEEIFFRLYRVDLTRAEPAAEEMDFNLNTRYAQPQIIGVTDEGKVLLWYTVNPAEKGLLLVG